MKYVHLPSLLVYTYVYNMLLYGYNGWLFYASVSANGDKNVTNATMGLAGKESVYL